VKFGLVEARLMGLSGRVQGVMLITSLGHELKQRTFSLRYLFGGYDMSACKNGVSVLLFKLIID
jgi:hypothetical protein